MRRKRRYYVFDDEPIVYFVNKPQMEFFIRHGVIEVRDGRYWSGATEFKIIQKIPIDTVIGLGMVGGQVSDGENK